MAVWLPLAGCSDAPDSTVSGKVTLDGQPLETGSINFVPTAGDAPTAGGTIQNGEYSVPLAPGAKRVEISATKVIGQRVDYAGTPQEQKVNIDESIVPERYNVSTELTADVKAGENTADFDLKSQ